MSAAWPTTWKSISALCLLGGLVSCLDTAGPERIVRGTVTDVDGAALAGAIVSVGARHAVTGPDGSFALEGLPPDAHGPITASATGYTAWSLDTAQLSGFSTRLRPRNSGGPTSGVTFDVTAQPAAVDRTLWITSDDGRVADFVLRAGAGAVRVDVILGVGERVVAVFGAGSPGVPALWMPPRSVSVTAEATAVVPASLEPAQFDSVEVGLSPSPPSTTEVSVACEIRGTSLLVGRSVVPAGMSRVPVDVLARADGGCDVVASYELDVGLGPIRHVGFLSGVKQATLGAVQLVLPPDTVLVPDSDDAIHWSPVPGADVYDVFLAPDGGDRAGPPIWSATTEGTQMALPSLPPEALDAIDGRAEDLLVRVVARFVPDLDIEDHWDWSTYHGYVASPWLPVSRKTLAPWR